MLSPTLLLAASAILPLASAHVAVFHKAAWGMNVTQGSFSYDNRAVTPLANMPFSQWWFHGHLSYPPPPNEFVQLPAGGSVNLQLAKDIGLTDICPWGPGGCTKVDNNLAFGNDNSITIHANNIQDVTGSAIAIAYKSDVNDVKPEDFVIISTVRQSPWYLNNQFDIPDELPACPNNKCICAWFWIHAADSGSEQMYMTGFQCQVTGNTGSKPIGKPGLARRCGADGSKPATPSNCTVGPVNPMYWYQAEGNNFFEGTYSPPLYNDLYGFPGGKQQNLFQDATVGGQAAPPPPPSAPQTTPAPANSPAPPPPASSPTSAKPNQAAAPPPPPASKPEQPAAPPPPPASPIVAPPASSPVSPAHPIVPPVPVGTTESISTPSAPAKCKSRKDSKRRRSAIKRHLKKRISHDGLTL
ncbi:hypothetical protein BDW22DRAFT_1342339 [Trametopsis cervina]|nr:hypothetical protein BDW22DRAFT_1342339 [Trametopsis cervina]